MSTTATGTVAASLLSSLRLNGSSPAPTSAAATPSRLKRAPLEPTGALDKYTKKNLTPVLGTQFREVQLPDLLTAENADELLRELAITVSRRCVVFFKDQHRKLSNDEIKLLANKLGQLSGRPAESGLHIHPTEHIPDPELSPITTSFIQRKPGTSLLASRGWHTDITFEPHPSDFAILNMWSIPENGGDTLWASAYEAYDRLTPALASFLEGLTAVNDGNGFHNRAQALNIKLHEGPRGHPLNVGGDLSTVHPVIRTNPITGWKGLFVNSAFTKRIVELNKDESDFLLEYLFKLVANNHDLQVRYRWDLNDVAIWSNTSSFHNVTVDYDGLDVRKGNRTVSLGEKPYFDPASKGRREALGLSPWLSE
ncbi:hypothetical protein JCM6882_000659 [Rhodosporidiobolus microsporus]